MPSDQWKSLVERLTREKLAVVFLLAILGAIALYLADHIWLSATWPPLGEMARAAANGLIAAAVIGLTFGWYLRHEAETHSRQILKDELNTATRTLYRDLAERLFLDPSFARTVLSSKRQELLLAALAAQFEEPGMAQELTDTFRPLLRQDSPHWRNYSHRVILGELEPTRFGLPVYRLHITLSYYSILKKDRFEFSLVQSKTDYNATIRRLMNEYCWVLPGIAIEKDTLPHVFRVTDVRVGDIVMQPELEELEKGRALLVAQDRRLREQLGKEVFVSYEIDTLARQVPGYIFLTISRATKEAVFELDWSGAARTRATAVDLFVSRTDPEIKYQPPDAPHRVEVGTTAWVFPQSGVVFVLQREHIDNR